MFMFSIAILLIAGALLLSKWRKAARLREEGSKVVDARIFAESVDQEIKRASRSRAPFSLVYLEARGDDAGGGTAKDETLAAVTSILLEHLRNTDLVARLGDGLAVLMPETKRSGAQAVMRKLKTAMARVAEAEHWPAAVGTCAFTCDASMLNPLETNAEKLLSEVRKAGRDSMQVTFAATASEETPATVAPGGGNVEGGP